MNLFKHIKEDINCIKVKDPAARGNFEIIFNYPGLHAITAYRMTHWLWGKRLFFIARFLSNIVRWLTLIEIHPAATIGRRLFIDHGAGIVIGATTEIDNDCTLYQGVTLGGTSLHDDKRHPTLKSGVIVGAGAKVLGPITLGENSRVGSNSVIINDVPANATSVGVPGRLVAVDKIAKQSKEKLANKLGFSAYGVDKNHPNPEAEAINLLVDKVNALEQKIKNIEEAQKKPSAKAKVVKDNKATSTKTK